MRQGYADLFRTFPDVHRKDNEALRNYFSAHTKVAESTLGLIVSTFKALATIADFEATTCAPIIDETQVPEVATPPRRKTVVSKIDQDPEARSFSGPTINIKLPLQLPATEDASTNDLLWGLALF